ncbi:MAG: hypothetical protein ACNA8W_22520, partial [Bradymonadaceae bacterium]
VLRRIAGYKMLSKDVVAYRVPERAAWRRCARFLAHQMSFYATLYDVYTARRRAASAPLDRRVGQHSCGL